MPAPYIVPRTIKPRKPADSFLPLIVVDSQASQIWVERTGEILPLSDLQTIVLREPSSYWIACNASMLLAELNDLMADYPSWQFRGSPRKRPVYSAIGETGALRISDFVVAYFGFRSEDKKKKGRYHYPIDPSIFMRRFTDTLGGSDLSHLIRWGIDVREWCVSQALTPKPTAGGIAAQLLKDPRFHPEDRRKVPRATNGRARAALPGNHYRLYADETKSYNAVYLDLASAHHHAAAAVTFPHPDNLYARGSFRVDDALLEDPNPDPARSWARPGSKIFDTVISRGHGLLLAYLTVPTMPAGAFPLPFLETPGRRMAFIHTNELADVMASGAIVEGFHAGWLSFTADIGMNKYAEWALAETAAANDQRRGWLKPVLLATYGVLASKPRVTEFAYGQAEGGVPKVYPAGGSTIQAIAKVSLTEKEMATANVIHRGMIEAETRLEVLKLARYLHTSGANVLSVYADSVIVENSGQLPLIPHPWRSKGALTNCRFFNATSFTSNELTKLPGIPLESLARTRMLADLHRAMNLPQEAVFKRGYTDGESLVRSRGRRRPAART